MIAPMFATLVTRVTHEVCGLGTVKASGPAADAETLAGKFAMERVTEVNRQG